MSVVAIGAITFIIGFAAGHWMGYWYGKWTELQKRTEELEFKLSHGQSGLEETK